MCVAILQPKGKVITPKQLWAGWMSNSDGGGMAYINNDGKVEVAKGFMEYNPFEKKYAEIVEKFGQNGPMLVHMRIRSAGDKSPENTHPFKIRNGALIHNGTMFHPRKEPNAKEHKCDSRVFAESLFNILTPEDVQDARRDLEMAVGYNKIAMLWDGGRWAILNEQSGYWIDGIWYSNNSCKVYETDPKISDKRTGHRAFGFHPRDEVRDQ